MPLMIRQPLRSLSWMRTVLGLVCLTVGLCAPGSPVRAETGPTIDSQACTTFDGPRLQRILTAVRGAAGDPWSSFDLVLVCQDESVNLTISRQGESDPINQALFFDSTGIVDREAWIADVILQLIRENWDDVPAPVPPVRPSAPTPPVAQSSESASDEPAPTFGELMGPAFLGVRASFRWLNVTDPTQIATVGVQLGRQQWPSVAPYLGIAYTTANRELVSTDLNLTMLHLGGGLIWRRPISSHWSVETEFGVSALKGTLTRHRSTAIDPRHQVKGWTAAVEINPMMVRRISSTRAALGPSLGWIFDMPVSNPVDAENVSVNGLWLGFMLHVGSTPAVH